MTKEDFESVWKNVLVPKASALGAVDGDLDKLRSKVKNYLASAGWVLPSGEMSFVSKTDKASCLSAAADQIARVVPTLVESRRVTRMQVTAATVSANFVSDPAAHVSASALPGMASMGDRCPRCSGSMEPVGLVNDRVGLYCTRDRVVLPLPEGTQLR